MTAGSFPDDPAAALSRLLERLREHGLQVSISGKGNC
jgi:hypothetical protein